MKNTFVRVGTQIGAFSLSLAFMLGMLVPGFAMGQNEQGTLTPEAAPQQGTVTPEQPPEQGTVNPGTAPNQGTLNSGQNNQPSGNAPVTTATPITGGIQNPLKGVTSIADLFYTIVGFVYSLSYAVIALFLIVSGFKFVAAQGAPEKLQDAKKTFYYTIIGAIILIGANVITEVVRNVINQFSVNKI